MRRLPAHVFPIVFSASLLSTFAFAQETTGAPSSEPAIRRWIEVQNWTLYSRYRYVENSANVKTADQVQYKDTLRVRFNIDEKKRYGVNVGFFSGSSFYSTWDNAGIGTGDRQTLHFVKQLFADAEPIDGLQLQYGGIYVNRGVNTEITTYDDDGYIMGERITIRRPKQLFFDEISGTRGLIGPFLTPSVGDRWRGLHEANYGQVLVAKRINKYIRASADYSNQQGQAGNDWFRGAVAVTLPEGWGLDGARWEQYARTTGKTAAGFALLGDVHATKYFRLEAGYVSIDEFYVGFPADKNAWNADRIQRGRRLVFYGTIPVFHDVSVAPYYTHAFRSPYTVALKNRFDLVVQYDLLGTLRRYNAL